MQAPQPMHSAGSCSVMPSAVLYMAFGLTGQASTHAALLQWLHSTGMTQWVVFGNVPSVFITKSAQLNVCSLPRVRMLFSALQAIAQAPHPTQRCRSMTIPNLILFSLGSSVG